MRNTRCATDLGRGRLVNLGSSRIQKECLPAAVYYNLEKDVIVVVHVDDFLCTGDGKTLEELHVKLSKAFEIKQKTLSMEDYREVSYLNRILKVNSEGINIIGDPKHSDLLVKEWGIQEYSKEVYTPSLKELEDQAGTGEELVGDVATKGETGDCPNQQHVARWTRSVRSCQGHVPTHVKATRRNRAYSQAMCALPQEDLVMAALVPWGVSEDECDLVAWTDSVWAGDVNARRSTSGGLITYRAQS